MIRKYFILLFMSFTILAGFYLSAAKKLPDANSFPAILLEKGSDTDQSYFSIKTKRDKTGDLLIRFSSWGDIQTRPFLKVSQINRTLKVKIFYEQEIIRDESISKMSFEYLLPLHEEQFLNQITFYHHNDSLVIKKQFTY